MAKIKRLPVSIVEVVRALEREAGNTDTDPRWLAASGLRRITDWDRRTLMCEVDVEPVAEVVALS